MIQEIAWVVTGALAGGFVTGLTGFGTGMTALVFWLHAMTPLTAAPLVAICSVVGQVQSLPSIRHALHIRVVAPFVAGGLLGIPVGAWLLTHLDLAVFKFWVGALITTYCAIVLAGGFRFRVRNQSRLLDGGIGLGGGVLGGLAGLSGPLPIIWVGLRGWDKDKRRAVVQVFNTVILGVAIAVYAAAGLLTFQLWRVVLIALPGTLIGAFIGQRVYRRLDDHRFDRLVLAVLLFAGVLLMASSLLPVDGSPVTKT